MRNLKSSIELLRLAGHYFGKTLQERLCFCGPKAFLIPPAPPAPPKVSTFQT